MVQAWYMDDSKEEQRLPHQTNPVEWVSLVQLKNLGVHYWSVDVDSLDENLSNPKLHQIRASRNYKNHDVIEITPEKLPNYHEKIKKFFEEHLHTDEEIRFCLAGSGYFDVRDTSDRWIRIHVSKGDMIVLPAGIYHRFTLDSSNYIKVMRLFQEEPQWTAYNRSNDTDAFPSRKDYIQTQHFRDNVEKKTSQNGTSFVLKHAAQAKANYPHLRQVNGFLFVSGVSSRRTDNSYVGVTETENGVVCDIKLQTRGVLENIATILASAGADLSHVVDMTCFLKNMKDYAGFNEVFNEYFPDKYTAPTRTTVSVVELPNPKILIEIKATAVVPSSANDNNQQKQQQEQEESKEQESSKKAKLNGTSDK